MTFFMFGIKIQANEGTSFGFFWTECNRLPLSSCNHKDSQWIRIPNHCSHPWNLCSQKQSWSLNRSISRLIFYTNESTTHLPFYLQQVVVMHILEAKLREQNPEVQQARACSVLQDLPVPSPEDHRPKMLHLCSFLPRSLQVLNSACVYHFGFSAFQLQLCKPVDIFG